MKQLPLPFTPPPAAGFDRLVVGANGQAIQHLQQLNPVPGTASTPVYLWGAAGTGKTRLLSALTAKHQARGERAGWFDAAAPLPWQLDPGWSLVVLDDVQHLDADHQQAAFVLFVDAGSHGVQWAAAGSLPPVDLPLRDDLRSRLGWGHVFALQPMSEADTRAALRREADHRGFLLNDEVMDYLMTRQRRDLGHLMGLLQRLDVFTLSEQRLVTIPLLRKMLAEEEAA